MKRKYKYLPAEKLREKIRARSGYAPAVKPQPLPPQVDLLPFMDRGVPIARYAAASNAAPGDSELVVALDQVSGVHPSPRTRFWRKVDKGDGCWIWTGWNVPDKYGGRGKMHVNGKGHDTTRISWMLHFGAIPEGLYICHTCDNGLCVRPEHLYLGTPHDNNEDMATKGRRGLARRLTPEQRAAIRDLSAAGVSMRTTEVVVGTTRQTARRYRVRADNEHDVKTR